MSEQEVETAVRQIEERLGIKATQVKEHIRQAGGRVADLVRAHPVITLGAAFVLGYFLARTARGS
jgi:ElaB/YqjD/DUF883 family membrane-anchored ribosome-binding protein